MSFSLTVTVVSVEDTSVYDPSVEDSSGVISELLLSPVHCSSSYR